MAKTAEQSKASETQSLKTCPKCGKAGRFKVDVTKDQKSCQHCGYILPTQIAHFKLVQIIGTGGMGAVYRGLDLSLERNVAVKVMREEFARNSDFVEKFLREARAAAALNHPNVAQIYSFGEQDSCYYLVMELLPNGSLDDRIETEKRVPEVEVLDIGIQVASGLRAAMERGLIHRDIKPGNILFAHDGTAKVVDFGLARFENKSEPSPEEDGIWGTPYYIAPEKVSDNQEDFRSDIYSLGGTLFHALAGRPPFDADSSTEVVLKHLKAPALSLKTFAPDCSPQSAEVIGRMLRRDPAERPQSYDELLNDLAYAKRFALERKPETIQAESEFSLTTIVSTIVILLAGMGALFWFWPYISELLKGMKSENISTVNAPAKPSPEKTPEKTPPTTTGTQTLPKPVPVKPEPPKVYDPASDIQEAINVIKNKNLTGALERFKEIQGKLPPKHPQRSLVALHIARLSILLGKPVPDSFKETFKEIFEKTPAFPTPIPPSQHPDFLAAIVQGNIAGDGVDKMISGLPEGTQALARLDAGRFAFSQKNFQEAARQWKFYSEAKTSSDQPWTLFYQSEIGEFLKAYEYYEKMQAAQGLIGNDLKKARQAVADFPPTIRASDLTKVLTDEAKKIRDGIVSQIDRLEKEEAARHEAAHAQEVDGDIKLIEKTIVQNQGMLTLYQFDKILDVWKNMDGKMMTKEGKEAVKRNVDTAQALVDLKNQITEDIRTIPYAGAALIKKNGGKTLGNLYQVEGGRLQFKDKFSQSDCAWEDLTASSMVDLGNFYLQKVMDNRTDPKRASKIASRGILMAVFFSELKPVRRDIDINTYFNIIKSEGGTEGADLISKYFSQPVSPKK